MSMRSSKVRVGRRGVEGNGWMNGCVDIGMGDSVGGLGWFLAKRKI